MHDKGRFIGPGLTRATRIGLNLLAVLGVILALYLGRSIFIPLVIAVLLAAMVYPWVAWLNRRLRFSWGFACMLVVGGLVALNLAVTLGFFIALPRMLQGMPDLRTSYGQAELYKLIRTRVEMVWPLDEESYPRDPDQSRVFGYIQQTLREGTYVTNTLWSIGYYTNNWLWEWVLVMFILLFLLMEGRMLSQRVVEIFGPSAEAQDKAVESLADMATAVRTYLVWRTVVNFALGLALGVVYRWVFGLTQPWTWGLVTAVACYVPYLGPIFAGMPPVLDAFLTSPAPVYALGVMAFYAFVITLEGYVLVPVVMGRSMELNATTVMLACMFWELVWGLPGLFLAMPLMAALKSICAHVPGWRPWANLMSTRHTDALLPTETPPEPPGERLGDTQIMSAADLAALEARQAAKQ